MEGIVKGNESNHIKAFNCDIDGVKIILSQVHSLKLKWSISDIKVTGELIFHDETSMVEEVPIRGGSTFTMSITDYDDVVMTHVMEVTKVDYTRAQNNKYINKLMLLDKVTIAALGKNPELSWAMTTQNEVIEAVIGGDLVGKGKDFEASPTIEEFFCIPKDRSFYKVLTYFRENNAQLFFQTRDNYKIKTFASLLGQGATGDKFVHTPNNKAYRRSVYEMNTKFGDKVKSLVYAPNINTKNYDKVTKETLPEMTDSATIPDQLSSPGATKSDHGYKDFREDSKTKNSMVRNEYHYKKNSYDDIKLEVLVPGKFENNVGDVVPLDLVNFLWRLKVRRIYQEIFL